MFGLRTRVRVGAGVDTNVRRGRPPTGPVAQHAALSPVVVNVTAMPLGVEQGAPPWPVAAKTRYLIDFADTTKAEGSQFAPTINLLDDDVPGMESLALGGPYDRAINDYRVLNGPQAVTEGATLNIYDYGVTDGTPPEHVIAVLFDSLTPGQSYTLTGYDSVDGFVTSYHYAELFVWWNAATSRHEWACTWYDFEGLFDANFDYWMMTTGVEVAVDTVYTATLRFGSARAPVVTVNGDVLPYTDTLDYTTETLHGPPPDLSGINPWVRGTLDADSNFAFFGWGGDWGSWDGYFSMSVVDFAGWVGYSGSCFSLDAADRAAIHAFTLARYSPVVTDEIIQQTISGTITSGIDLSPVEGADVVLRGPCASGDAVGPTLDTTTTAADGTYAFAPVDIGAADSIGVTSNDPALLDTVRSVPVSFADDTLTVDAELTDATWLPTDAATLEGWWSAADTGTITGTPNITALAAKNGGAAFDQAKNGSGNIVTDTFTHDGKNILLLDDDTNGLQGVETAHATVTTRSTFLHVTLPKSSVPMGHSETRTSGFINYACGFRQAITHPGGYNDTPAGQVDADLNVQFYVRGYDLGPDGLRVFRNGLVDGTDATPLPPMTGNIYYGLLNHFNGAPSGSLFFAEAVRLQNAADDADLYRLFDYLNAKWGSVY